MKYFEYIPGGNDNPNSVYIYNSRLNNQPITGFYNIDDNGNAWQGKYEQIYSKTYSKNGTSWPLDSAATWLPILFKQLQDYITLQ